MTLSYRDMAASGRVPGGTPVYGEGHAPSDDEREQIREFVVFLAARNVLINASPHRHPGWMVESARHIRDELDRLLPRVRPGALATSSLRAMHFECEKLLMHSNGGYRQERRGLFGRRQRRPPLFWIAVGSLRTLFGVQIAVLCVLYGVDLDGPITTILPRG
ncbi:MAG: hypothetical protein JXA74_01890 [Anaerolineae bacterium]|nr:hypothetical protein [Anaerolineae bacterium]